MSGCDVNKGRYGPGFKYIYNSPLNFSVTINPLVIMLRRYLSANVEHSGKRTVDDVERRVLYVELKKEIICNMLVALYFFIITRENYSGN